MKDTNLTIAVDGYSSCGKSTVAKQIAKEYNFIHIDTGAMYRAVALFLLRNNIELSDNMAIENALVNIVISFRQKDNHQSICLNGEEVESMIRTKEINDIVSEVATISSIRKKLVQLQRTMSEGLSVVMDGRDIGTVVFPNADIKFFLTAEKDIRAQRRFDEMIEKGIPGDFEEIKENLIKRDLIDSTREDSPLKQADDAILIDNSYLTKEDQTKKLKSIIDQYILNQN